MQASLSPKRDGETGKQEDEKQRREAEVTGT